MYSTGSVGKPFPSVSIRIKTNDDFIVAEGDHNKIISYTDDNVEGSLLVKGPSVFKEYWRKAKATADTFDEEGWFITGNYNILIICSICMKIDYF